MVRWTEEQYEAHKAKRGETLHTCWFTGKNCVQCLYPICTDGKDEWCEGCDGGPTPGPQPEPPVRHERKDIPASTDECKLNKTERAFLAELRRAYAWVGVQCITLKIADDCRYTPDLWTCGHGGGSDFTAYEVKGFWRDDAKVKIKVAARLFPMIRFIVVTKNKSGWVQSTVKP